LYRDGVLDRERIMIYDQSWRLLEERIDDDFDASPGRDRTHAPRTSTPTVTPTPTVRGAGSLRRSAPV